MKRIIKKYKNARRIHILTVGIIVFLLQGVQAQSVLSVSPTINNNQAAKDVNIAITFSTAMTLSSNNTFVMGSQTGLITGTFSNNGTTTVTFDPTSDFKPGELVTVQLTAATGLLNPYNFSFRVQPTANTITAASAVQKNTISSVSKLIDVASGDLDGDGDIDMIAVSHTTSELIWFQNDGAATPVFTAQPALYDGADTEELISVVLGDADNDGDLDIFFGAEIADKIFFIKNNGGGTFGAVTEINTGTADGLTTVFLGDLDGDGLVDVLASSAADNTIAWYKNNNGTGFGSETIISNSLGGAFSIKVGDMDGDGDLDVIGAAMSGNEIRWYANDGSGVFSTNTLVASNVNGASSVSIGDIDGDGDLDIAATALVDNKVSWYENTGSGASFTERTVYHDASGTSSDRAINVDIKDMDGDGDLDILWAADVQAGTGGAIGTLGWSRNDGGSPISWTYLPVDATATRGYSVDAADLTGDGMLEFIGTALGDAGGTGADLSWYKLGAMFISSSPVANSSNVARDANIVMTFNNPITLTSGNTIIMGSLTGVISGSFNNNGTTTVTFDPATDFKPGEYITVQITGVPYNFSFWVQPTTHAISPISASLENSVSTTAGIRDIVSADLDDDGHIDIVSVNQTDDTLVWYQNDGSGNPDYSTQTILYDGTNDGLASVKLKDANNDGDLDIFFIGTTSDKIYFIENQGSGSFGTQIEVNPSSTFSVSSITVNDVDSDGLVDVVSSSVTQSNLRWYKNMGNHSFGSEQVIPLGLPGDIIKMVDIDGDGDLDIISMSNDFEETYYIENLGQGNFSTNEVNISYINDFRDVNFGDMDGDGDLDILLSGSDGDAIYWYRNDGGSFNSFTTVHSTIDLSLEVQNIKVADVDGDGDLDVVWIANIFTNDEPNVAWSRNDNGDGSSWTYMKVHTTTDGRSIDVADVNGDGNLELLSASLTGNTLSWYKLNMPVFVSATPSVNSATAATDANIVMTFSAPITLSASNTIVSGSQTGLITGTFSNNGSTTVTFDPATNFKPGELITVQLTTGTSMVSPYNFSFGVQPTANTITPTFPIQENIVSTVSNLFDVASGDLDGDGDIDMVAVSSETSQLLWFQNDGAATPTFTAQPALYTDAGGEDLLSVVLGDANNDGDLDIFFMGTLSNKIYFIENNGNGTFETTVTFSASGSLLLPALSLGDLDGDGLIDILVSSYIGNAISWYKNNGSHNFGPETVIDNSLNAAFSVKAGDMDNDGDLDVIASVDDGANSYIGWYPNNGDGTFGTINSIFQVAAGERSGISLGDLDGDGDLDIAFGSRLNPGTFSWIENQGSGTSFTVRSITTTAGSIYRIAIKDLDGDGDLDVLWGEDVAPAGSGNIRWSRNDGGSPLSWTDMSVDATAYKGSGIDAADLDGNGTLEFIATALGDSGTGAALSWYKLSPPVFMSATPSVNSTTVATNANITLTFNDFVTLSSNNMIVTGSQTGVISGTFSNNGTTTITFDPVTDFKSGELITVQLTTGTGILSPYNFSFRVQPTTNTITPASPVQKNTISTVSKLIDVASGDLDGDGHIDLIAVSHTTSELIWFQNDGATIPAFTAQPALYDGADTEELISVVLGDADNDGDLDIFFGAEIADKIFFIENNGDGTFEAATEINAGTADGLTTVFLGDLDGDGFIDILASSAADNTLAWYKNNGGTGFGSETIISSSLVGAFSVKVGDMDGDGDLDVIGAAATGDEILLYPNNGDGSFGTSIQVGAFDDGVSSISIGDLDGDGDLDVASAHLEDDGIFWYENTLSGASFIERTVFSSLVGSERAVNVDIKDLDGDGDLDILWAADERPIGSGTIAWSRNDGGSPISWTYIPVDATATRGYSVDAADLTGNGKLEFIGTALGDAGGTGAALSWYSYNVNAWTGATSTDWNTATNWSLGSVPVANEIVTIDTNTNIPEINQANAISNLMITSPGALTITASGSLTVSNGAVLDHGSSILVDGTYTGGLTYNLTIPDTNWHLISSPVTGEQYDDAWITENGIASGSGNNRGIASYTNATSSNGDWAYFQAGNPAENFNTAQGYSMLKTVSGSYGFIGSLQNSDQNPVITTSDIGGANENRWNLIGNPFPSYIDVNAFLTLSGNATALTDTHQAIYVWNGTRYTPINSGYIHPGQGFFVNSDIASTSVALSKNMLSHQTGVSFHRNSQNNLARLIVHLSDQDNTDLSTEIQYREGQTKGLDPGFDLGSFTGASSSFSLNTHLVEDSDGTDFTIQSLSDSSDCLDNVVIPLSVKASFGKELTFSITTADFPEDVTVYLEDVAENTFTRLDVSGSEYKVTIDEGISGIGRFYIHTNPGALGLEDEIIADVKIYAHEGTLYIQGLLEKEAEIALYDLLGRRAMLHAFRGNGNNQIALPPDISKGIYLVRLTTEEGKLNKKIVLK